MKKPLIIALTALAAVGAFAQRTTKLTASKANDFGIAYSLPTTAFDIVIEAEMVELEPGEFSNYASLLLNAQGAISSPQYSASVKSINVVPRAIPDEDNRWMVEFKGSGITYMMLDDAGVPLTINSEDVSQVPSPSLPTPQKAGPTALETDAARQAVTQEMTKSTSVGRRAQLAAQRIFELREIRSDLISGNAENTPPDGKSMQLMLDNLAAQEAALTAMFVGTERRWTDVKTITYIPGEEPDNNKVIARISPISGIVDADDLSGIPVSLTLTVLATGKIPADEAGQPKKAPKEGVAYNIPGTIGLQLFFADKQLLSQQYETSQYGATFWLDPKLFTDKKKPAYVIFNPLTGGISQIGTINAKE